ncbi:sporulation integral membrane protein YtvI [Pullulanibacillus sp. KACC 23026]|uniref:sporulation integral membrane protein YtvI n=1 Tax=Pullulanibacillus sp. KACC 23026 TaxID=3028315 RepID=UPI0023B0AD5E|nr:sporulation integral membrane protein YtvI [Pullulanibacillus sp. KACC 23026]WEG13905.1 sporulation integral membrane protein YtvI [Pullulanibacillus sp. KACC 23026]
MEVSHLNSHYITNILRYIFITFRLLLVAAICVLIGAAFYYGIKYAYPFIIAIILSFFLNPVVTFIQVKTNMHRGVATFIVIFLIFAVISGIVTLIILQLINGLVYLNDVVPSHVQLLSRYIQSYFVNTLLPMWGHITHLISTLDQSEQLTIQDNMNHLGQKLATNLSNLGTHVITYLTNMVVSLPNIITGLIFICLATFFMTKDWYKLGDYFDSKLPESVSRSLQNVYEGLRQAFLGFIRAHLTLISITAVIILIGLVVLRVAHPVTIAFLTGLADMFPYLGTGSVFLPWIIYSYFSKQYFMAIGLAILYAVVIIQRQIMEPKIISSNIGLNPLPTLVAIFIGFKLLGFLGLVLGPIVLIVINTLSQADVFRNIWSYIIGDRTLPK